FQMPGTSLGDISRIPAPGLKHPKGIRDIEEWYISLSLRPDYVRRVLELQTAIGLENMKRVHQLGGDELCDVIHLSGTDFGTQQGLFCSLDTFEHIFAPSYRKLCGWVHENTPWKTFKHSCGSVEPLIDPLLEVGFDILNPVQCSAANMAPEMLKKKYGDRLVFWGGGIDTQRVLPFGTPEEVKTQVWERLKVFSPGGGFVFATIHNTQARTPLANFLAMVDALNEFNG
ncbi:MAG: methyltransferase, partial [Planctomycetes bacterium]|nr:methyltransferase [Planctomycetota bacterium]